MNRFAGIGLNQKKIETPDLNEYASGRASTMSEALPNAVSKGWNYGKAFGDNIILNIMNSLESKGIQPDMELKEQVNSQLEETRNLIRQLDSQNADYSSNGNVIEKFAKNGVLGLVENIADLPNLALSTTVGLATGGTGLIAKTGIEIAKDIGIDYYRKAHTMGEEYTASDFTDNLFSNVATGVLGAGIEFGIGKMKDNISIFNNADTKKVVKNFAEKINDKVLETGIGFDKKDLDSFLVYNGYTTEQVKKFKLDKENLELSMPKIAELEEKISKLESKKMTNKNKQKYRKLNKELKELKSKTTDIDVDEINYTLEKFNKGDFEVSEETVKRMAQKEFNVTDTKNKLISESTEEVNLMNNEIDETINPDIKTYGYNRVAKAKLESAVKTFRTSIEEAKVGVTEKEIQNILLDNVYNPYKNTEGNVYSGLKNALKNVEYNSMLSYSNTINKLNKNGINVADFLIRTKDIGNLNETLLKPLQEFKNSFDRNFDFLVKASKEKITKETALASAYYNRSDFFETIKGGIKLNKDYMGNYNFKNLKEIEITELKNNFKNMFTDLFNGETFEVKNKNIDTFIEEFFPEFLGGGAGTGNRLRASSLHRYSIFSKFSDTDLISQENLVNLFKKTTNASDSVIIDNVIDDLSHSIALTKHFGVDLQNLVDTASDLEGIFKKGFSGMADTSKAYHNPVQTFKEIIKDELGLNVKGSEAQFLNTLGKMIYAPFKPLSATFQASEFAVAEMDVYRHFNYKNRSILTGAFDKFKSMPTSKKRELELVSMWYNRIEKEIDLKKKAIDTTDMSALSKSLYYFNRGVDIVNDLSDKASLFKQQQNFYDIAKSFNAVKYTRDIFDMDWQEVTSKITVKDTLARLGIDKVEFDIIKKYAGDQFEIIPRELEKALKGADLSSLKSKYNLSTNELATLLSGKLESLQANIMKHSDATKPNPFTRVTGGDFQSRLIAYASLFLKKSGLSSTTRAWDILINSSRRHNSGMPIKEEFVKNLFTNMEGLTYIALTNKLSRITRRVLTTETDIDTILDEELDMSGWDLYVEPKDVAKFALSNMLEGAYINSGLSQSIIQSYAENLEKGNLGAIGGMFTPRIARPLKRIIE